MSAQHHEAEIDHDVEQKLVRLLGEANAAHRPAELVLSGRRYRLVPVEDLQPTEDTFRDYDPDRARAAVVAAAGALEGLDVEAFLDEVMDSREQDTPGHRWP